MLLADFVRLPPAIRGDVVEGLAAAIDTVAERGAASHRFLRFGWYAAALAAYGGQARTLVVEEDGAPVLTLPFVPFGPAVVRMAAVPGCYWPFRSFGVALGTSDAALKVALSVLASHVNALRIGPVQDDDPAVHALVSAARAQGWIAIDRQLGESWTLDLPRPDTASEPWPRNSTLRKNRFHEKHLAEHGVPEWRFLSGADWPTGFAALGTVEAASWVGQADRTDPKFARGAHLAFWQAAAADTALAAMFRAALLTIDGDPAAFSFDIDTGDLLYAVANSYDPRFAKHSPGKLLQWRNLVTARDRGVRRVDWGSGDSGYKQVLGARPGSPIRDWILLRPGLPALAGRTFAALLGQKSLRSSSPA
jgi:CelD/BcsL family acetyltransferase involved in cellulose biosynthesis